MKRYIAIALLALTAWVFVPEVYAADVDTLCWTNPTERMDNTPLAAGELAGTEVYNADGTLLLPNIIIGTCVDITAISTPRSIYLRSVDSDGRRSAPTPTVILAGVKQSPKPQTGITVTRSIKDVLPTP